jgi:ubiquinone/menaquinone biosynthesis C-methylase UbiE
MNSFLDKFIRWLRLRQIQKYIFKDAIICDIGCGSNPYFLKSVESLIKSGVGVDKKIEEHKGAKIEFINLKVFKNIPLEEEKFDVVVMTAFLEHLDYPQEILKEAFRILKKGGKLIITTPTPLSKKVLEILAYNFKIIDEGEVRDHKHYFWPKNIKKMLLELGFREKNIQIRFFEFFLNSITVAEK